MEEFGLTEEECDELDKQFHVWNGDPQEHVPGRNKIQSDFALMHFFAAKLRGEDKFVR
jgi:hypothetical protein